MTSTIERPAEATTEAVSRSPQITQSPMLGIGVALGALGLLLAIVAARTTDFADVDGYGLISAFPQTYWFGVAAATVASALLLWSAPRSPRFVGAAVPALWIGVLHTAPQLAHAWARFSIVYIHLGFIDVIDDTATGDILIDARFAWPGFFGLFVPVLADLDPQVLDWLMRLWPTGITIATAVLVGALARRSYPNRPLIGSVSALVFIVLSWTGQDYFSPQSLGFLLYLAIVIVIESGPLRPQGSWSSVAPILSRFATAGGDRAEARQPASFVALLILGFGAIASHPLAPFFICAGLAMLGFYGRTVAWRLLVILGFSYLLWVYVAAQPWWGPRLEELTGQFGSFFSNFESSTEERTALSSPEHLVVAQVRTWVGLATFLSTLFLGSLMAADRFRALRPTLPLAPLAGIPVLAAALQSYGGEIIIRVLLFTLPMASILVARMLLAVPRSVMPLMVPVFMAALTPAFIVARFGNESFEMTTEADYQAVQVLYEEMQPGTMLIADNSFLPWGTQNRHTHDHLYSRAEISEAWLADLQAKAIERGNDDILVVFTPSQSAFLEHVESAPPDSLDRVGEWMATQPGVRVVAQGGGAWVLGVDVPDEVDPDADASGIVSAVGS
ncbi:MAG: hypothetical protein AAF467_02890 [Actinomycetota bacterium]